MIKDKWRNGQNRLRNGAKKGLNGKSWSDQIRF